MNFYKADLHVHSVLSPCGDLEMSPVNIINRAAEKGLDILGLTDHNTTLHCRLVWELGRKKGIYVLPGAEVNSKEEVHCLTFFEDFERLDEFQDYLDRYLPDVINDPVKMGYQVQVDQDDFIVYEEGKSLYSGINQSIEQILEKVHNLDGLFFPAHVDRTKNSVYSQLGIFPPDLKADGIEISWRTQADVFIMEHPELKEFPVISSSDAHFMVDIGKKTTNFKMKTRSFGEIRAALKGINGREVNIQ